MTDKEDNRIVLKKELNAPFENICRTCLSNNITMFSLSDIDDEKNMKISDMLFECTSIQVSVEDPLPKIICENCVKQIVINYEFKLSCLKAEQTILSQISENYRVLNIKYELSDYDDADNLNQLDNDNDSLLDHLPLSFRKFKTKSVDRQIRKFDRTRWFSTVKDGYKCIECSETCKSRSLLREHVEENHPDAFSYPCSVCPDMFKTSYNLKRHQRTCHKSRKMEEDDDEVENHSNDENLGENKFRSYDLSNDKSIDDQYSEEPLTEEQIDMADKKLRKLKNKSYECMVCGYTKINKTCMLEHVYFHLNIRRFQCLECNKKFVLKGNVRRHIKDMHSSRSVKKPRFIKAEHHCPECPEVFQALNLFQQHLIEVHKHKERKGYNPVTCELCDKSIYNSTALKKHIKAMHSKKEFHCEWCAKSYHTEKGLMGHRRVHGLKTGYHCKYCIRTMSSQKELDEHVLENHKNAETFKCEICGKEFFIEEYLIKHIKNHSAKPEHLCTTCGKTFLLKCNLITHSRVHTGEKPYVCNVCNAAFNQHASLRFHLAKHTDERRFECDQCGTKFKRRHDLNSHVKIHSDIKNYICNVCGKDFVTRKRLTSHAKIHSGEKPFVCNTCGKAFSRSTNLKVHLRIHSGERPFVCQVCGKGFNQNHCLVTHVNNHHKS